MSKRIKAKRTNVPSEMELAHKALSRRVAVEGIVLLENNGILPIKPGKIALYGEGAKQTVKGGHGSGEVTVRHEVTVKEGLENAGFTVTTEEWIANYEKRWQEGKKAFIRKYRKKLLRPSTQTLAELVAAEYKYPSGRLISKEDVKSSDTDVCIYVIARLSGEGQDRAVEEGNYLLSKAELENIRRCAKAYTHFIVVLNAGTSLDVSFIDTIPGIDALVFMGQLGMEGGNALADALTGKDTPSGKLATTWVKNYKDIPFGDEFGKYAKNALRADYKEGIYVGYRYYDTFGIEPKYEFGYGKSYTEFAWDVSDIRISGKTIEICANVSNIGTVYSGKEVLQVYVSCPDGKLEKEAKRLVTFAKTKFIAPAESTELKLAFQVEYLSCYDEGCAETILEAGGYIIYMGTSSRCVKEIAVLQIRDNIVLERHKNLCHAESAIATLKKEETVREISGNLPLLELDGKLFKTIIHDYKEKRHMFHEKTEKFLSQFTEKDMASFCSGLGLIGDGKGFQVPGTVGFTTADYLKQGIPNLSMCDGPAGLRIQMRSTITKKGKIKPVDAPISIYEFLPKVLTKCLLGNPEKEEMLYQYVTGFPVAAVVAQTFNTELAYQMGEAVSSEMTEYGVTYWLAPALNIVRNPLCGRNYEYYSEDPVVSGMFAAAVVRGVESVPGNYATIKHFALNNQEENRYYVSSNVDERVVREIYLKGFEITVKEAHPRALMTSYNKINGTYAANSRELCTDILRGEWGFDGVVMTDWLSTGEDRASDIEALKAGVDVIMPGSKKVMKKLAQNAENGVLDKKYLRRACGNMLDSIFNSAIKM